MVDCNTETWFEIEFTRPGQQDWVLLAGAETLDEARAQVAEHKAHGEEFVYRIVRKTLTVELLDEQSRPQGMA